MADDNKKKKDEERYKSIKLEIVVKDGNVIFSKEVALAGFPGEEGVFTVYAGHTPFFSSLRYGEIRYKFDEEAEHYNYASIIGGFCEVNPEKINVITNSCELAENIDINRAESARKRAENRLASQGEDIDFSRAEAALKRSLARISVYNLYKSAQ